MSEGDTMQNEDKHQSPYRGFAMTLIALIATPAAFYWLIYLLQSEYLHTPEALNIASAKALGCGCGAIFHLMCLVSGAFRPGWQAVKYRMREFRENLVVSVGYAFESYWEDIRSDGVTFLISFAVVAANLVITLDGLVDALGML